MILQTPQITRSLRSADKHKCYNCQNKIVLRQAESSLKPSLRDWIHPLSERASAEHI